jgi:HAD superfamily hydrolase (TIGR01509 family)
MTRRRPTAAVIVDCDGVLVNSEEILQEVELAVLAEAGLTYDRQEYMDRFMGTSEAAWWQGLELDAVARLGRSIVNEVRGPLAERMRAELRTRLAEIPGASAAISKVRQPKAVASSSGNESLHLKLTTVGHWELFAPHIYSADDVGATKPAPDLFLHAAGKLGVDATECLVIEDSVNGILAANAAGMRVWGFVGGGHHTNASGAHLLDAGAERLVSSWVEAGELLQQL